jgi:sulfonate transport system substrate-binding protein
VPKKSTVKTFAELKGGKIAFLKATNSYIAFLHQLKAANLPESDFHIVEITGPPGNKAFQTEQVNAYYSINPNMASLLEETGGREIATCEEAGVQNLYPYMATENALKTKSKALQKFVQALANTYQWISQHRTEQAKLLAKKLDYSEASILTTYKIGAQTLQPINSSFYASEQKLATELAAAKILKQPLQVQKVFLSTYNSYITANGE